MEHYKASSTFLFVFLTVFSVPVRCGAQTFCSLKVPVPDMGYCDASGLVEDTVQASVYRTQGNIEGVQEYQRQNFDIFDEQLTDILTKSDETDMNIRGVEEEITDLAHMLSNIQAVQAYEETLSFGEDARERRAASPSQAQLQQLLDSARLTFQQAVADVVVKLQNLTQVINDKARQTAATHAKMQADLTSHKSSLITVEQQLKTIDASVQKLVGNTGNTGTAGTNLNSVRQDVTDLLINASVAEQIHERQLDGVEQLLKHGETPSYSASHKAPSYVQRSHISKNILKRYGTLQTVDTQTAPLPADIKQLKSDLTAIEASLAKDAQSIAVTKGAQRILEDRVGDVLSNATRDVAALQSELAGERQNITQLGLDSVKVLTETSQLRKDLNKTSQKVDGVQTLVSFTNKLQLQQSGQILTMNKIVRSDIKLLKYAFGLLTSFP